MQIENRWRTTIFCKLQKREILEEEPRENTNFMFFREWWLAATFFGENFEFQNKLKLWNTQMIFMKYTQFTTGYSSGYLPGYL